MSIAQQAEGFVLVGGASARMGRDKALLELGGVPLLVYTARIVQQALKESAMRIRGLNRANDAVSFAGEAASVNEVRAVSSREIGGAGSGGSGTDAADSASEVSSASKVRAIGSPVSYGALGVTVVPDEWPGAGPLGGIATALRASQQPWNLIVACDLPYLTTAWLAYLLSRVASLSAADSGAEAIVPINAGGPEPLCAIYHKRAEPKIVAALDAGDRKVKAILKSLQIETIEPREWKAFDSDGLLFKNMNTPADYEEAVARLGSGAGNRART
jgi:molybdenum cofactor guanylyltransferase